MTRSPGPQPPATDSTANAPAARAGGVKRWAGVAFIIFAIKGLLWLLVPFLILSAGC